MTGVKICGLRSVQDAQMVRAAGANYAGCILAAGFRRSIDRRTAQQLRDVLSPDIPLVGVFVNDSFETVAAYLNDDIIDIAQLHGQESDALVAQLQRSSGKPVWKVFRMNGQPDYHAIAVSCADLVLLDAGTGSGETFDWRAAQGIDRPFVLAGGLTAENVAQAIAQAAPLVVDTSSGVETGGRKNNEKIAAFVRAVRREQHE